MTATEVASYPFALSAEQEERAARLHREAIILDMVSMHAGGRIFAYYPPALRGDLRARLAQCPEPMDQLLLCIDWPFEQALDETSDLLWRWLRASGLTCGAYDIFLSEAPGGDPLRTPWDAPLARYAALPWVRLVRSAADIRAAKRDGVLGLYPFYQPVWPLVRDLASLDEAHARGLRALMLTYNRMDHVGSGCTERVDGGLSWFGLEVVARCNALGLMVDVSHCGPQTTRDACAHSAHPVVASHSGARQLYDHPRNKSDEEISAIAATGGVIGIPAVPYFLSGDPAATIEAMLDHIGHVAAVAGWQHVAIGTDWPIQAPDDILEASLGGASYSAGAGWGSGLRRDVTQRLVGFEDCRDFPNITRGLVARGYSDEQVTAILGGNALRVFEQVCG